MTIQYICGNATAPEGEGARVAITTIGLECTKFYVMMGDGLYNPGFRMSILDLVVLVVADTIALGLWFVLGPIGLLFPFVVGHFFLFCNVFRTARNLELA